MPPKSPSEPVPDPPPRPPFDVLCLCHLAWEPTLFQRPQQIMSRLAARGHRVVFAGFIGARRAWARRLAGAASGESPDGLLRWMDVPHAPAARRFVAARDIAAGVQLSRHMDALGRNRREVVVWLYHPSLLATGLALAGRDATVVYDVMDRFPAFRSPRPGADDDETRCHRRADLAMAGGRSLHAAAVADRARAGIDPAAPAPLCLPSGVDLAHFAAALDSGTAVDPAIASLPKPVFGYFGAIDERVDFDLLAHVAGAFPAATVALVGPVVGDAPAGLPANVRLMGPRPYADLPAALKGFDVALLPFRDTPLTAYVSPTKTPEYLAGGKPVVSTPIPDVVADWSGAVAIARGPADFSAACAAALTDPTPPESRAAMAAGRARTWDALTLEMERAVERVVRDKFSNAAQRSPGRNP